MEITTFRGRLVSYVQPADVVVGDRIACWLSDVSAYPHVTGGTSRKRDLTRYGIPVEWVTEYTVDSAPWWVDRTFLAFTADRDRVPVLVEGPITAEATDAWQAARLDALLERVLG